MSTRDSTSEPWSAPVNLAVLNSPLMDGGRMSLSFDAARFTSRPAGQAVLQWGSLRNNAEQTKQGVTGTGTPAESAPVRKKMPSAIPAKAS